LPDDFNVVAEGGYYALQERYRKFHQQNLFMDIQFEMLVKQLSHFFQHISKMKVAEVGKESFIKCKKNLPDAAPIVNAGGFANIYKLAADPKAELVKLIVENLKATGGKGTYSDEGKIDMLVALLQSKGEGFCSVKVDGEWEEVLARQGKKSTKRQKLVSGAKKLIRPTSNFNVKNMGFQTTVLSPRGNGVLKANVKVSIYVDCYIE
jgi:hypothetical protein